MRRFGVNIIFVLVLVCLQQPAGEQRASVSEQVLIVGDVHMGAAAERDIGFLKSATRRTGALDPAMRAGLIEMLLPYLGQSAAIGLDTGRSPQELAMRQRRDVRALWVLREVTGLQLPGPQTDEWNDDPVTGNDTWRAEAAAQVRAYLKGYLDGRTGHAAALSIQAARVEEVKKLADDPATVLQASVKFLELLLDEQPLGKSVAPLVEKLPPSARVDGEIHYTFDTGFAGVRVRLLLTNEQVLRGIIVGG